MPYIDSNRRPLLNKWIENVKAEDTDIGGLNYIITKIVLKWIKRDQPSYLNYNQAIGVLECVKQELYRKAVAKYEDKKCEENGEVYY